MWSSISAQGTGIGQTVAIYSEYVALSAPSCAGADEILGLYPICTDRLALPHALSSGSSAEGRSSLAVWVQLKRRTAAGPSSGVADPAQVVPDHATGNTAIASTCFEAVQEISIRLGRVFVAWVPGLAGRVLHAGRQWMPPDPAAAQVLQRPLPPTAVPGGGNTHTAAADLPQQKLWLSGVLWEGDLLVDSLQLAALSQEETGAEAVLVSIAKLSGRLGPVKAAVTAMTLAGTRVRTSVTSELMRLSGTAACQQGGARWVAAPAWPPILPLHTEGSHSHLKSSLTC